MNGNVTAVIGCLRDLLILKTQFAGCPCGWVLFPSHVDTLEVTTTAEWVKKVAAAVFFFSLENGNWREKVKRKVYSKSWFTSGRLGSLDAASVVLYWRACFSCQFPSLPFLIPTTGRVTRNEMPTGQGFLEKYSSKPPNAPVPTLGVIWEKVVDRSLKWIWRSNSYPACSPAFHATPAPPERRHKKPAFSFQRGKGTFSGISAGFSSSVKGRVEGPPPVSRIRFSFYPYKQKSFCLHFA